MGQEAICSVRVGEKESDGKVLFENDALVFRGDFRLSVPLAAIRSAHAQAGQLSLKLDDRLVVFTLGPLAEKWADRIRHPRSLIDKLGIKEGQRIAVIGIADPPFERLLETRAGKVVRGRPRGKADVIFLAASRSADLEKLQSLLDRLEPDGAIWTIRPKGRPEITERETMAAGRRAGLVDVKVVSFSATHTAEKFVIPLARRGRAK